MSLIFMAKKLQEQGESETTLYKFSACDLHVPGDPESWDLAAAAGHV